MNDRKVLVGTRGPLAIPWQVAMPRDGLPFMLLGWRVAPELERDGGMPEAVGMLLADALLRVGALSYPSSSEPASSLDTQARLLSRGTMGERLRALLTRAPLKIWLVTTTSSTVARQLFDDPGFPWWMQGQIVLISTAEAPAALERTELLELMDPMRPIHRADFSALSLKAVIQPGVDGDVAALISVDADTDAAIVGAIESCARESEFQWKAVSEAEFARVLSEERSVPTGTV